MSQEECARLRDGVPYVKVYRYNLKHLCPNFNGYGDNGQRKVWYTCGSTLCTFLLTILPFPSWSLVSYDRYSSHSKPLNCHVTSPLGNLIYNAWNPKDNYDMSASVFVVQFNGFMSLTS